MQGLPAPLQQLSSIHTLLDIVEQMAMESKGYESGDAVQRLIFDLYKPDANELKKDLEETDTDALFDEFAALGFH